MRRIFSLMSAGLSAVVGLTLIAPNAAAQSRTVTAQEYIQSTSPLAGGGSVTSISTPGQSVQTITTIAALPAITPQQPAVSTGFTPRTNAPFGTGVIQQPASGNVAAGGTNTRYAYPASSPPTTYSTAGSSFTPATPGIPNYGNNSQFSVRDYQNQALGATLNSRQVADTSYRPNAPVLATPTGQFNYPYQYGMAVPQYQQASTQPPSQIGTVPNLSVQMPGQPAFANPAVPAGTMTGNVVPNANAPQAVNYQNMPPGTYAGRNISGKPKNYVDGQPLRNLFRYISF